MRWTAQSAWGSSSGRGRGKQRWQMPMAMLAVGIEQGEHTGEATVLGCAVLVQVAAAFHCHAAAATIGECH